ncbi:MAG: hypothetical protein ACJ75J_01625, partial [Cytophagaceae bacterium]
MKKSMRYIIATVSLLLLCCSVEVIHGCGWFLLREEYRISLFYPEVVSDKSMSPFYFTTSFLNGEYQDLSGERSEDERLVLEEWFQYCKGEAAMADIDAILYDTEPEKLISYEKYAQYSRDTGLSSNTFLNYLIEHENKEAFSYILYAKKNEYLNYSMDPWEDDQWDKDFNAIRQLIHEGDSLYSVTGSSFLKLRYAYQIVRALRNTGQWGDCIALYDSLIEPSKEKSMVKWWALSHKATAANFSGNSAYADYLFSKVFANSKDKVNRAFMGFEGKDMDSSLKFV